MDRETGAAAGVGRALLLDVEIVVVVTVCVVVVDCGVAAGKAGCDCADAKLAAAKKVKARDSFLT